MQTIQLHLYEKPQLPTICAVQGDVGRKFQAVITDGTLGYTIPGDASFSLWYAGTSGEGNYTWVGDHNAFAVEGDTVTVELITQMLSCPGGGELCLCMSLPDGSWLGLWTIPYQVDALPGADSPEAVQSYTAFSDSVGQLLQAAEKIVPDATLSQAGRPADAAAVGAALAEIGPGGFGLGGSSVTAKDHADECVYNGWYKVQNGGIYGDGDPCYIQTVAFGIDGGSVACMQLGYRIGWNNTSNRMDYIKACRFLDGQTGWSPWEYENPPLTALMEYRTPLRHRGKVVYTKLVLAHYLPNAGTENFRTGVQAGNIIRQNNTLHFSNGIATQSPYFAADGSLEIRHCFNGTDLQITTTGDHSATTAAFQIWYVKD